MFFDAINEAMHELDIIFEVKFPGLEGFLFISDIIFKFSCLFLFDVDVHFGEVDFLLLVEEVVDGLLLLCVMEGLPLRSALTRNFLSFLFWAAPTKSLRPVRGFCFLKM